MLSWTVNNKIWNKERSICRKIYTKREFKEISEISVDDTIRWWYFSEKKALVFFYSVINRNYTVMIEPLRYRVWHIFRPFVRPSPDKSLAKFQGYKSSSTCRRRISLSLAHPATPARKVFRALVSRFHLRELSSLVDFIEPDEPRQTRDEADWNNSLPPLDDDVTRVYQRRHNYRPRSITYHSETRKCCLFLLVVEQAWYNILSILFFFFLTSSATTSCDLFEFKKEYYFYKLHACEIIFWEIHLRNQEAREPHACNWIFFFNFAKLRKLSTLVS